MIQEPVQSTRRPTRWLAALLVLGVAQGGVAADDFGTDAPAAKRSEGRYFLELAEIMLTTEQFDLAVASVDPLGPGAGAPAYDEVAVLSGRKIGPPRVTIGLNRPNGTQFAVQVHDFSQSARYIPQNFEGREGNVLTPYLLPDGIVFQRQGTRATSPAMPDDDYTPNWAVDSAYIRRYNYKGVDFTMAKPLWQNKQVRLRWTTGLRYAQLEQGISQAAAYAQEHGRIPLAGGVQAFEAQDFFFLQTTVQTHGLGPKFGLEMSLTPFKSKRWSFDARADVAFIPESTTATYGLRLIDDTTEYTEVTIPDPGGGAAMVLVFRRPESPIIPGLQVSATTPIFAAEAQQDDFTDLTYHFTGQVGFRFQPRPFFSVGLDVWHMRWHGLLSQVGMLQTVSSGATYEIVPGDPFARDPALTNTESVLHIPRYTKREDYAFDGVSLNLTFQF